MEDLLILKTFPLLFRPQSIQTSSRTLSQSTDLTSRQLQMLELIFYPSVEFSLPGLVSEEEVVTQLLERLLHLLMQSDLLLLLLQLKVQVGVLYSLKR